MSEDKPGDRIAGVNLKGFSPIIPYANDVRREMNALHDRVLALEQKLVQPVTILGKNNAWKWDGKEKTEILMGASEPPKQMKLAEIINETWYEKSVPLETPFGISIRLAEATLKAVEEAIDEYDGFDYVTKNILKQFIRERLG